MTTAQIKSKIQEYALNTWLGKFKGDVTVTFDTIIKHGTALVEVKDPSGTLVGFANYAGYEIDFILSR